MDGILDGNQSAVVKDYENVKTTHSQKILRKW